MCLQALTHGNEVCGAIALDWLLGKGVRPHRGALSICFANIEAYRSFDHADPYASRCIDEDFNRLWTDEVLGGPRQSAELARARELRPLYDGVEYLLDLHSMTDPCPPLAMAGRRRKGVDCSRRRSACPNTWSSTAATPQASACATTRFSTMPTIRATRC